MAEKRKSKGSGSPWNKKARQEDTSTGNIDPAPPSDRYRKPWYALAGWFLGPRSENREEMNRLTLQSLNRYHDCRQGYYPADPCYITEDIKAAKPYRNEINDLEDELKVMHDELVDSIPFFSTRYQGHMTWECTMPSILGYFSGMLWNQNNTDSTASPVTTVFELKVGQHLCQLMNFNTSDPDIQPWAHITGCGSVANIEAMWASRNLKFHALAVQAAVTDKSIKDQPLAKGAKTKVFVPEVGDEMELQKCTQWQLLNLDVDEVCGLTQNVLNTAGLEDATSLDEQLKKFSLVSIGMANFVIQHKLKQTPVVLSPGTNHYSWPKSATILGLGDQNILQIHVDKNARQDMKVLEDTLEDCLNKKIPIIMVVAVFGSTEESAVDPMDKIVQLRKKYRRKGLNFSIHADAAWGGYMLTMLRRSPGDRLIKRKNLDEDFIPVIPLSDYATTQYKMIRLADTVTIDPHKAGFCLYPAGGLAYRNGTMKGFITLKAPEVFHGENDVTVGVYGLEGSKPGAAAAGILLSHRVIGLDQLGYGRILGQCQLGSKLCYCMWMTVAQDFDDFVCLNFIDIPEDYMDESEAKKFIRERILGRDNADLYHDKKAMKFLKTVGPDALINTFVVNLKDNTDTQVCNDLQMIIFNELTTSVGESSKRVPLFLTTSTLEHEKYGGAFVQLKNRLQLEGEDPLGFLRNTCMNPFQCSEAYVTQMGIIFRNTVLNCIGALSAPDGDEPVIQNFVVAGRMNKHGKVFLDHMPSYAQKNLQYHVVITMLATDDDTSNDKTKFRELQKSQQATFFLRTRAPIRMHDLLRTTKDDQGKPIYHEMEVRKGDPNGREKEVISLILDEVFRYQHLESLEASKHLDYPESQKYFMYGDKKRAYISHVISKWPDSYQVVELDELPHSVPLELLDLGLIATIPEIPGRPFTLSGKISDPLQRESYTVNFKGKEYADCVTTIKLFKRNAKKWFDAEMLNKVD